MAENERLTREISIYLDRLQQCHEGGEVLYRLWSPEKNEYLKAVFTDLKSAQWYANEMYATVETWRATRL